MLISKLMCYISFESLNFEPSYHYSLMFFSSPTGPIFAVACIRYLNFNKYISDEQYLFFFLSAIALSLSTSLCKGNVARGLVLLSGVIYSTPKCLSLKSIFILL